MPTPTVPTQPGAINLELDQLTDDDIIDIKPATQRSSQATLGKITEYVAGHIPPPVIPPATTTTLGGVIVGDGLEVQPNGLLSGAIATPTARGEVKIGDGLLVDGTGLTQLKPATGTTIGGIIVGSGLSILPDGTLSAFGGGGSALNNQWTAAQIAGLVVPLDITFLQTTGRLLPGDRGNAYYIRVVSQPSHPGFIQDLSGAFFEMIAYGGFVNLLAFAAGNGVLNSITGAYTGTNDVNAVLFWAQTALALQAKAYAPAGNYLIASLGSFASLTGSYDNTTGIITLTSAGTTKAVPGAWVKLTGLTGTGSFASLGGAKTPWLALPGTGGNTTILQGPIGVGASTITGGTATIQNGIELATATGLTIYGDGGATVFVHQLAGDQMWWFGADARFSNVNFVIPADTDILTTAPAGKGSTTLTLNTLAINGITRDVQPNDWIAIIDPSVNIPYHIGTILPITAVSVGTSTTFTFSGTNSFDVGDTVIVSGTTGTISAINNDSYLVLASSGQTITLDVDTTGLVWGGGGQLGNGGLAGHPSQTAQVRSISGTTITLNETLEFDYDTNTQIGVWYNPTTDLTIRNLNIAFDPTKAKTGGGVVAAVRFDSCINTRLEDVTYLNATNRTTTIEDCLWGTMSNVVTYTWQDNSPTNGFQGATSHWLAENCLQYGGAHIVQIGSNPDQVGTNYIKMVGCHALCGGQMGDTHWNARMVSFVGCTSGPTSRQYIGTTNLDAGFTVRAYQGVEILDCSTFNRSVGARLHCGTDARVVNFKAEGCNYGLYINQWDGVVVQGSEFKNCILYGIYHLSTVGPSQNFSVNKNMVFKGNRFIGPPPETADYFLQLSQQNPEDLAGNGWSYDDNAAIGRPTIFTGAGTAAGMFDIGYQSSPGTDIAIQSFGPFFSMAPSVGATAIVPTVSGVTASYKINEIIAIAGGAGGTLRTISNVTQANPAKVTTSTGHGLNDGDSVWIFNVGGMVELNNGTYTVTKIDSTNVTLDGVDSTGFTPFTTGGSIGTSPELVAKGMVKTLQLINGTIHADGAGFQDHDLITLNGGTSSVKAVLDVLTDGAGNVTSFTVNTGGSYSLILAGSGIYTQFSATQHSLGAISSGTYDTSTGHIVLTMASPPGFAYGEATLSTLTGTGTNLATLNNNWPVISIVSSTVTLQGPTGKGSITITGGSATAGGLGFQLNAAIFGPLTVLTIAPGEYTAEAPNPAAQASTTGDGAGATYAVTYETMINSQASPKPCVGVTGTGATITDLGPTVGGAIRIFKFTGANTIVASSKIVNPGGLDITTAANLVLTYYADPTIPAWVCGSPGNSSLLIQQAAFPVAPAAGSLLEWADDTGRFWRMASSGRNRGFLTETGRLAQARAVDNTNAFSVSGTTFTAISGTATAVAAAVTNAYTRQPRILVASAASTNTNAAWQSSTPIWMDDRGRVTITWGWEVGAGAYFVGIKAAGDLGTTQPSALTNCFGFGINLTQPNLHLVHAGASNTTLDLGANFPAFSVATDYYEVSFWWAAGGAKIWYQVVRTQADGTQNIAVGTVSANVPPTGTTLVAGLWSNTRSSSAANQLACMEAIVEGG